MKKFTLDPKSRFTSGKEKSSEYFITKHPLKGSTIIAMLPNETKLKTPEYLDHLELLGVPHTAVEGQELRTDTQGRVRIPDDYWRVAERKHDGMVNLANVGGVDFFFMAPTAEERKQDFEKLKAVRPMSSAKIAIPEIGGSPEHIGNQLTAIRRGTAKHRKNSMFSKHRRHK